MIDVDARRMTIADVEGASGEQVAAVEPRARGVAMTAIAEAAAVRPLHRIARRTWGALVAAWGGFIGLLPHVLHHVGPLAGAALLADVGGTALFAAIGFVAAIPFLLRLHRRFQSWRAPALALAVFAVMFSLSSFVIGPAIAGEDAPATPQPGIEQPSGHEQHH